MFQVDNKEEINDSKLIHLNLNRVEIETSNKNYYMCILSRKKKKSENQHCEKKSHFLCFFKLFLTIDVFILIGLVCPIILTT